MAKKTFFFFCISYLCKGIIRESKVAVVLANAPSFFKYCLFLRRFKRLKRRVNALSQSPDSVAQKAIEAEKAALDEQIDHRLSHTSVEVLKKYRSGARIQAVNYLSVKDIEKTPANKLANLRGVGPKSAYALKSCANAYIQEVKQNERLHISPDNRTAKASTLVKSLYQLDKLTEISEEGKFLRDTALGDKDLIKRARASANPIIWLFSKNKQEAIESMQEIHTLLQSPLETEILQLEGKRSEILKAAHKAYWSAFCEDPARYYALLDENHSQRKGAKKRAEDKSYLDVFDPGLREQIEHVQLRTEGLKCVLRPYQKFGVKYILNQGNVLLGDEMGLGKTIEAIATIVSLKNNGDTHFVVVCPASVLINWKREISKHSDLSCYVLHGSSFQDNLKRWVSNGGVAITNFENTSRFAYDGEITLTVVDEAHYIKNYSTARTRNTIKILNKSRRRLLMSGTPLENKLDEMVSLINLLQPEIVRKIYALPQPINRHDFRRVVAPVYFRRTKDAVWREMPDLQVVEDVVELTPAERALYVACVRQGTMSAFAKMRQISFEVEDDKDSSKLSRIKEICNEAFENGRKVIIFSFYLGTIQRVYKYLGESAFGPITGSISPQKRQQIIDEFSAYEGGAVLLSQILAGGTGLNIQKASIVIMCEPQYKPSIENQAIARAYRIGQTSNVTVYRLLGERTIDERILQILKEKQALFDAYANKSESGEQSIQVSEKDLAEYEFANSRVS